jgi:hypothetical protein
MPEDTVYGKSDHMWLIDENIFPRTAGKGGNRLVTPSAQSGIRDRVDVNAALPSPTGGFLPSSPSGTS